MQNIDELANRLAKLNARDQTLVEELIDKLESRSSQPWMTIDEAVTEFEREHSELLRLLAQ